MTRSWKTRVLQGSGLPTVHLDRTGQFVNSLQAASLTSKARPLTPLSGAPLGRTEHPLTLETVHACPPEGEVLTPCCNEVPFLLPRTDRMTLDLALVTCKGGPLTLGGGT